MDKLTYLFELDSARVSLVEIEAGQNALLHQLALGNYVVLTYNQLADSPAFLACVYNKDLYEQVIGLFENGGIRVSHWASKNEIIRSPSQYVQNAIQRTLGENDETFTFACLPNVKHKNPFLQLVQEALRTSNPNLIRDYRDQGLVTDVTDFNGLNIDPLEGVAEKDIDYLVRYLDLILRLSRESSYCIAPYKGYNGPTMDALIKETLDEVGLLMTYDSTEDDTKPQDMDELTPIRELWPKASSLLSDQLACLRKCGTANQRSAWRNELSKQHEQQNGSDDACKLADIIVDLCYNFASKYSISPAFNSLYDRRSFAAELIEELLPYWKDVCNGRHNCFRKDENAHQNMAKYSPSPDWLSVIDLRSGEAKPSGNLRIADSTKDAGEVKGWAKKYRKRARKAFRFATLCMIAYFAFDLLFDILPEIPSYFDAGRADLETDELSLLLPYILSNVLLQALSLIPKTLVFGIIAGAIAELLPLPEVFVSAKSIRRAITEHRMISRIEKQELGTLKRKSDNVEKWSAQLEKRHASERPVSESREFKSRVDPYLQYANEHPDLFMNNVPYPVILDRSELARFETAHPESRIGIRHQSDYNIFLVDLLDAGEDKRIVYERIVPAASDGAVIIIPVQGERFVLLHQYRHAIQRYQLAFPRGFGEPGLTAEENAVKELFEEVGATALQPEILGEIALNSGLEGGCVSVVCCNISEIRQPHGQEGIEEIVLASADEIEQMIAAGKITDAPTIAAYACYRTKKAHP